MHMKSFSEFIDGLLHPNEAKPPFQIINTQTTLPSTKEGSEDQSPPPGSSIPKQSGSSTEQVPQSNEQPAA